MGGRRAAGEVSPVDGVRASDGRYRGLNNATGIEMKRMQQ